MNQENEKKFEENQLAEKFERKTFESESFLVKKPKNLLKEKTNLTTQHNDVNVYKPRFKPKTITVRSHLTFNQPI